MTKVKSIAAANDASNVPLAVVMGWLLVVAAGCAFGAYQAIQIERIFNLGPFVKYFIATIIGLFGLAALAAVPMIATRKGDGRLIGMGVSFVVAVLSGLYLLQLVGMFVGLDYLAETLYHNAMLFLAIPLGYLFVWIGGRFRDGSEQQIMATRVGMGIMVAAVAAVLVVPHRNNDFTTSVIAVSVVNFFTQLGTNPQVAITITIFVVSAVMTYVLQQAGTVFNETPFERDTWQGWMFLMPNFISFMLFFAGPLMLSLYLSFTDYRPQMQDSPNVVGLQNYGNILGMSIGTLAAADQSPSEVLAENHTELSRFQMGTTTYVIGARDRTFWVSLGQTIYYCLMLLPLAIVPALLLAIVLNSKIPGMTFFRAIFFIPSIAAVVGIALVWQWLYSPTVGFINYTIKGIVEFFGGVDPSIQWRTDTNVMMIAVVIMAAWQVLGFNAVIFLAGLQGVSKDVIEASTVDGANAVQRFFNITLPLIAPTTFFVTVTTLIAGLQAFSEQYSLFEVNNQSEARLTAVFYLYNKAFRESESGYASAVAWVVFILVFIVTLIQFRLSNSNEAYSD
jgi:ABC-type sugar transport system permease subunit